MNGIDLFPLCGKHLCIYACYYFNAFDFMFTGLVSRVDSITVASSSPIGGLGRLHCGIRASMGQGNQLTEEELTPVEHRIIGRISKKILSVENIG